MGEIKLNNMSIKCEPNSQNYYIKKILHFQDELIDVIDIKETYINNVLTNEIYISRQKESTCCPDCNSQN